MASDFNSLLRVHGAMVKRIAASYEADSHRLEDLAQDIALALWRSRDRISAAHKPKAYIARIAQNIAVSHVDKAVKSPKGEEVPDTLTDPTPLAEQNLDVRQQRERLSRAVLALPVALKPVVTMALEGFSHREIGEALGLTENNVGVRFARAKAKLKELMQQDEVVS